MKVSLSVIFLSCSILLKAQSTTIISGTITDEAGRSVENVMLHYGLHNLTEDTGYTDKKGYFKITYPNPQKTGYYFYLEKKEYLPKSIRIQLSNNDIRIDTSIILRSRKKYWYDSKKIDSTHIGITFRQAIVKYKLDLNSCYLVQEPIRVIRGIRTELGDSSYIFLATKSFYDSTKYKIENLLDSTVTGIAVADTRGHEIYFGKGFLWNGGISNPYYIEVLWKKENEEKKKH